MTRPDTDWNTDGLPTPSHNGQKLEIRFPAGWCDSDDPQEICHLVAAHGIWIYPDGDFDRPGIIHGSGAGWRYTSQWGLPEIRATLNDILLAAAAGDHEAAHMEEKRLLSKTLRIIADGAPNAAELAKAACESSNIKFLRSFV